MQTHWQLTTTNQVLCNAFKNLEVIFALDGEKITHDKVSDVIKVTYNGIQYYVKRYTSAGKSLRKFLGKPRVQGEWESLQRFAQWGIPTANLIGFGFEKKWGIFHRGAMITQALPNTIDLANLADRHGLADANKVKIISVQLANIARTLHVHQFIHNDFKWRNILIDDNNQVYLIDCPLGDFWRGQFFRYRQIKDLKTLDNRAKKHLRRTQRMRFYLDYLDTPKLNDDHKKLLRSLLERRSRRHDSKSNLSLIFK